MAYVIGNAWCDENGKSTGGKPGDQIQKDTPDWYGEVRLQYFYVSSKGWFILRLKSVKFAKKTAKLMVKACNNTNIGYSQSTRYGVVEYGIKTRQPVNCDCSSLVRECLQEATKTSIPDFSTDNEVSVLLATGLFEPVIEYNSNTTLYTGDVIVTKTKGHTAIVTEGEARVNPYTEPILPVTSKQIIEERGLYAGNYLYKGEGVKWVQHELCRVGFQQEIDNCGGIDGYCGGGTVDCITRFQIAKGLTVDGICGKQTRKALKRA